MMKDDWYYDLDDEEDGERNIVKPDLTDVLTRDDPHEFLSLVKSNIESAGSCCSENSHMRVGKLNQCDILNGAIRTGAVRCANAFLEGKTGLLMNVNACLQSGVHPLNEAAFLLTYDFVDLFLLHGADPDFRSGKYELLLPIESALYTFIFFLESGTGPASKESFYKLFTALCHTEKMNEPLETVRLLASRMDKRNFKKVFNNYAKEGKLVEMTVLLIVAKDRVMPRSTPQSKNVSNVNGSMRIRNNIIEEMGSLADAQSKLSIVYGRGSELVQKCEAKRVALLSALLLLDLFEKAGDAIGLYFRSQPINVPEEKVAKDIAVILEKAGCVLKDIDLRNIDCENSKIKEAARSYENIPADRSQQHLGLPLNPPTARFCDAKWVNESWSRPPGIQVEQMKRSYHTWSPALRSDLPAHRCLRHYSGFNGLVKAQSKGKTIATQRPMCLPCKSSNLLASLALASKRVMRHI